MILSPGVAGAALEPPGPGPDLPEDAGVEDDQGRHGHQVQRHVHTRGALEKHSFKLKIIKLYIFREKKSSI